MVVSKKNLTLFIYSKQIDPSVVDDIGFFFLYKGATTSFRPIYKCHVQQRGFKKKLFFKGATSFIKSNC
jgi:hypothetical protein